MSIHHEVSIHCDNCGHWEHGNEQTTHQRRKAGWLIWRSGDYGSYRHLCPKYGRRRTSGRPDRKGRGRVTTIADLTRLVAKVQQLERLERDHLLTLAAVGATDEMIAEAAITMTVARFPSPPAPGAVGWGATPAEVGGAVVAALRLCGRMANPTNEGETRWQP